ncbi:Dam family site-specific DNA-(adenine-N6)-methyltransferase [Leptolyngbya sp. FACHB-711]|uniref:DNA adenine methylase n=1 Tax=Leptolyngbya sp. FACHB-711 TaxID=2692813 RepID=UPI00168976B2|nr:Dam family site-specific DNA-(adenine-N6)-methyltransferase [Leptolyngbya sp. FACHB-711]
MQLQQLSLLSSAPCQVKPFKAQLLKWIGNKQRFAHEIVSYFPESFNTYYEPFLGSGAVLGTLAPRKAVASDVFQPLIGIWQTLHQSPDALKIWYEQRWLALKNGNKVEEYEKIKASYNNCPNAADLLFLSRSCYGGVVRFRKADGYMSTPCGVHDPISPTSFAQRVDEWHQRTIGTTFLHQDYKLAMEVAEKGDLIYCDPPYTFTQSILYGAQEFELSDLFDAIQQCKQRGVYVALSIDGTKKSGNFLCNLPIPEHLFEREIFVNCGRSMLKRFQMNGKTLEEEIVLDRLLLTY